MPGVIHARAMPGVRMLVGRVPGMGMLVGCVPGMRMLVGCVPDVRMLVGCARGVFAVFVMCGVFSHGRSPSM